MWKSSMRKAPVEAPFPLLLQISSCATIWDPLGLFSPSHSSHSNTLVCALTLSQAAMATSLTLHAQLAHL